MKKIAVILILLVYGSTTIGATVHLHYCMNEFVGWSLWHKGKENECGKCGMKEKKGGCCKDEHRHVQLKVDHQKSSVAYHITLTEATSITTPFLTFILKASPLPHHIPVSNAPPHIPKGNLYIFHCVLLV